MKQSHGLSIQLMVPTLANTWSFKAALEMYRGDAEAALHAAETLAELSREHGLALYLAYAAAVLWLGARPARR